MDTKVNYVAVGLFVIALVAVLIGIVIWLTTLRIEEDTQKYVTYLRDEVSGLNQRSDVRFSGVKIGYVDTVRLDPQDPRRVMVVMKIKKSAPITTATVARLSSEGLSGVHYIGLKALVPHASPLTVCPGQKYPIIPSEPSLLVKMSDAIKKVTESITGLSNDIRQVFDKENRLAFKNALQNIEKITHAIAINSQNINQSLQSTNQLLLNSAAASKELPIMMQRINATLAEIDKTAKSMTRAGVSVANTMDQSTKTVQNVSHQLIPTAQQLLMNLDNLAATLQQVSREVKLNPGILVRGKAPALPGPGESR
ncbi:MAG: hypothetical protein A3F41_04210 [Coxiella sp. RIFCSPHIGHO2_12_FULL_44_14]|nr:MAG: hypothetical protein A3F41_04210 [Coxiella sp. RIFCSPHIGHO2_12_FULL_44_14]